MLNLSRAVLDRLGNPVYARTDVELAKQALVELGIDLNHPFAEFSLQYSGPFGSQCTGFELLDVCEQDTSILTLTRAVRKKFHFPERFIVLTNLLGGGVLMMDSITTSVYDVDFEGGDRELLAGTHPPQWTTFSEFLEKYFSVPDKASGNTTSVPRWGPITTLNTIAFSGFDGKCDAETPPPTDASGK